MRNIFKYGLLAMAIAVTSVGVRAQDIPVSGVVKDKSNNSTSVSYTHLTLPTNSLV